MDGEQRVSIIWCALREIALCVEFWEKEIQEEKERSRKQCKRMKWGKRKIIIND
jgi:hypothetical protein